MGKEREVATLGGGCFWCLEAAFGDLNGVESVVSGYAGGHVANPTYKAVCGGDTGHAEVVQVTYDPEVISYPDVLGAFFSIHDPTTLNRQGHDIGTQYRSAIYWSSDAQRDLAIASRDAFARALSKEGYGAITTELRAAPEFFYAEDYHQQYLAKNPAGYCGIGGTGVSCPIGVGRS